MRVVCESCQAVYAIDSALIPPKGARAQCPRCKHQQRVMPEDASAAAPTAAVAPAAPSGPVAPPVNWEAPTPYDPTVPSTRSHPVSPPPAVPVPPQAKASPPPAPRSTPSRGKPAAPQPLGAGTPVPSNPAQAKLGSAGAPVPSNPGLSQPAPSAAAQAPSNPVGPQAPGSPAWANPELTQPMSVDLFPPSPSAVTQIGAMERCQVCGTPLADAFDRALGICDNCRQDQSVPGFSTGVSKAAAPLPPPVAAPAPQSAPVSTAPRQKPKPPANGQELDELFDAALSEGGSAAVRAELFDMGKPAPVIKPAPAEPPPPAEPSVVVDPGAVEVAPAPTPEVTAPPQAAARRPVAAPSSAAVSAARPAASRRPRSLWLAVGGLVLVLGAAGAAAVLLREPAAPGQTGAVQLPAAIEQVLPRWRLAFVDLTGTSEEYLAQGRARFAEDTLPAYDEAEELFQKALSLDPTSDEAIAGYVTAVAIGRGALIDDETYREAFGLVEAAETRSPGKSDVLVAKALLLLTRESEAQRLQARNVAQRALSVATTPEEKARSEAAVGLSFVQTSVQLAIHHLDKALEADPDFKRVLYYRGLAQEVAGEYRAAIKDFQARLARNPGHVETTAALARIYEEVGEVGKAKALYLDVQRRNPDDLRSAVTLAAIAYQLEGKPKEAVAQLRALLNDSLSAPPAVRAEAWVHLAAAERLAGNLDGATAAAQEALKLPTGGAPGHLQLFLVDLQRGALEQAAPHLERLEPKALSPALVKHLEGRLLFAKGGFADAARAFSEAHQLEPRRLDSLIYAGVATVRSGQRDEGYRLLTQAMQADPTRLGPRPAFALHYLQPGDTLEGASGHLLAAREPNNPMPPTLEGFIKFHQRDYAEADRLLKLATDSSNNAFAYAYRALTALARGDKATALAEGTRAASNGRQLALAHYALGAALAADGQVVPAKKELRQARDLSPTLLAAELMIGQLEAKTNGAEAQETARSHLVRVTGLDPSYLPAKRALYALGR